MQVVQLSSCLVCIGTQLMALRIDPLQVTRGLQPVSHNYHSHKSRYPYINPNPIHRYADNLSKTIETFYDMELNLREFYGLLNL